MIRSMRVTQARTPDHLSEDEHEEQEEDARHFEHNDAADAGKWTDKAPYSPPNIGGYLSGLSSRISLNSRPTHSGNRDRPCRSSTRIGSGSGQPLPGKPSCHAKPHPQHSANGLRSHPVYDGSSEGPGARFTV